MSRFLLAQLFMDHFANTMDVDAIVESLEDLQRKQDAYKSAYDAVMRRIESQLLWQRRLAEKALSWILCAARPLKIKELEHILAIKPGLPASSGPSRTIAVEKVLACCAGLVTVDRQTNMVSFVHLTVREYLQCNWKEWPVAANILVARVCTADALASASRHTYGFVVPRYTIEYWAGHANLLIRRKENYAAHEALLEITELLRDKIAPRYLADRTRNFEGRDNWFSPRPPNRNGFLAIHLAAMLGYEFLLQHCIDHEMPLDAQDDTLRTPLHHAVEMGNARAVQLLIRGLAKCSTRDRLGRTPLHLACMFGHGKIVELLLDTGNVDVNATDSLGHSALHLATAYGQKSALRLLLATDNLDADIEDGEGMTVLTHVLSGQRIEVTPDASNYIQLQGQETPLAAVSCQLQSREITPSEALEIVTMFQESGKVDLNAKDKAGRTALSVAAFMGYEDIVEYLLNTVKVQIDLDDQKYRTAQFFAALQGKELIVKLLIDAGLDAKSVQDAKDCYRESQGYQIHVRANNLFQRAPGSEWREVLGNESTGIRLNYPTLWQPIPLSLLAERWAHSFRVSVKSGSAE